MRKIVIAVLFTICGVAWGQALFMTGPGEITAGVEAIATDIIDFNEKNETARLLRKAIFYDPHRIEGISIPEYNGRGTPDSVWVQITGLYGNWTWQHKGEPIPVGNHMFEASMLYKESTPVAILLGDPNRIEGTYCVLWTNYLNIYIPVLVLCDRKWDN
ncbi:MAG: hypothetical protein K2I74_04555 [Treponemataceae bacterium]|nr:hypothetical protein [Treponemataceae bacterium]